MATATYIDIAKSTIVATTTSPTETIQNDEAACYLYFTPIPGTPSIGTNTNSNNNKNNMHAACRNALSAQNKKMTTPPTVPLEVALAAAHPDGSFDMEETWCGGVGAGHARRIVHPEHIRAGGARVRVGAESSQE